MKSILFFVVIIGIAAVYYVFNQQYCNEGFQSTELNVPLAGPTPTQIVTGDPAAFAPPSTALLAPPPGQSASVNTQPYEDPAMQKASADDINNAYVTLQGFMTNEAPSIQEMGDPSIQLPLSTARSDINRLRDELDVLERNPGLESSLTIDDLNGIEANLAYLQRKWRLSANSETQVEGFECEPCKAGSFFSLFGKTEGFQVGVSTPNVVAAEASSVSIHSTDGDAITVNDLKDLSDRVGVEILRLSASGTTDPVIVARTNSLNIIQRTVNDIISEVNSGNRRLSEVPLTKSDITTFIPIMSNLNNPVPQLLAEKTGNPALQNLVQASMGGDKQSAAQAMELFDKYAAKFLKNISWKFDVSYMSDSERDVTMAEATAIQSLLASNATSGPVANGKAAPASGSAYPGHFNSVVQNLGNGPIGTNKGTKAQVIKAQAETGKNFDWKNRSIHICQQVAARGMKPSEFGCIENPDSVGEGFAWRGYTKMVCNRIATLFDPNVPEACGCPPISWVGWRS